MHDYFSKFQNAKITKKIIKIPLTSNYSGQVSLEYLLLLAAFFAALGLILPVVSFSASQFLDSSDILLAKRISAEASEKIELLTFLGDGSKFELEYFPVKEITVYSKGTQVIISAGGKDFIFETNFTQLLVKESFSKKFKIIISKIGKNVQVIAQVS